ncbi:hypothetical protein LJC55_02415 [Eubacteriales bacterium OttesenSCG-928-N14]|nr:hypothetical protein [Eubacteriales bacterium OttesenSCG-928-N14]
MMRSRFDEQLTKLDAALMDMSVLVESSIAVAIEALHCKASWARAR